MPACYTSKTFPLNNVRFLRSDDGALDDVRSSMNFDIIYKDVTGSTNDDVWDLANHGAHPGVAVRALRQESGRGQWKRVHG